MNIPVPGLKIAGPRGKGTVTLEQLLGGGAFGMVYRAKDDDGTQYAVKFPQAAFSGGPELQAFFNEVQAASQVQHMNVTRVVHVEVNAVDTPPYLVMEYLPDGTLKGRLDRAKAARDTVPPNLVRQWSLALIDGMEAINAKMLHRDLKPDNILMAGDVPKIADFGLSKIVGAATRTNTFKGGQHTLYMAPEGWRLETNDIQIDMYALGIVLYEIAALNYPFKLPNDLRDFAALQRMHLFEAAHPLQNLRSDLPAGFSHAVTKLMEKRAQDRFTTWREAREAVRQAFASAGAVSSKPGVSALVQVIGQLHDKQSRERLDAEAREAAARESQEMDQYQADKLVEELKEAVATFNASSSLAKIEHFKRAHREDFNLPYGGGPFMLNFFKVDPPLKLKRGTVRFAALVKDNEGGGLNFLLCRSDDVDLYGRWIPLRVTLNTFAKAHRARNRPQPFGFDETEMNNIAQADGGMHVYNLDWPETSAADAFLLSARQTIERKQGK
jgi:eukaryotic-like serine/threonine-protein kinase